MNDWHRSQSCMGPPWCVHEYAYDGIPKWVASKVATSSSYLPNQLSQVANSSLLQLYPSWELCMKTKKHINEKSMTKISMIHHFLHPKLPNSTYLMKYAFRGNWVFFWDESPQKCSGKVVQKRKGITTNPKSSVTC